MELGLDIVALGELLIDFTPTHCAGAGICFEQNPGGAPANVLACAQNLGMRTAFLGKVGKDAFGHFLADCLSSRGIDVSGLIVDPAVETTLAFVHLFEDGNRDFSFYRARGADKFLTEGEVRFDLIDRARAFHFGSLSLTDEPTRSACLAAAEYAAAHGKLVSYDPNWRAPLWADQATGIEWMLRGLAFAEVIKVSEEELAMLTGTEDMRDGIRALFEKAGRMKVLAVTMGAQGCVIATREGSTGIPGVPANAVDTTGAGDCFMGALLYGLLGAGAPVAELTMDKLCDCARFANRAAARCTEKKGGIPSMPKPEEL